MRLYARRAGFSLSDHGICEASHARGVGRGQRLWTGPPIAQQQFLEEKDRWDRVTMVDPGMRNVNVGEKVGVWGIWMHLDHLEASNMRF